MVQNCPAVVHGYRRAVLTPNVMEFARLCKVQGVDPAEGAKEEVCSRLARSFGGVTIVQKGPVDYISNGDTTLVCDIEGGLKRSGGQGDTLTGALVTFLAWGKAYREKMWEWVYPVLGGRGGGRTDGGTGMMIRFRTRS